MKRFTETGKWDDPWFWELTPVSKLFWIFLCDHCDSAGIIEISFRLASGKIGCAIKEEHLAELQSRLQTLECGKVMITGFIPFQYGTLSAECKPHQSVFASLSKHGVDLPQKERVSKGYPKGIHTLQEKEKEKEKEQEGGVQRGKPTIEAVREYAVKVGLPESDGDWFWNKCEANGWTNGGQKIKSWPHTIASWKSAGYMPSQKNQKSNGGGPGHTRSF